MNLEKRKVKIYDLPIDPNVSILYPEQVIIRFPDGKKVDIGSLCYLVRQPTLKVHQGVVRASRMGREVQLSSLSEQRYKGIRLLISFISELILNSGKRIATIKDQVSRFMVFMFWVDQNGFSQVLDKSDLGKKILIQYTQYLKDRVSRNEIAIKSAARQQKVIIKFLCDFWNNEDLKQDIPFITLKKSSGNITQPPCEDAKAKVLSLCEHIFDGLTSLILEHKAYPYSLTLPKYLNFKDNMIWIFPAELWFIHPEKMHQKRSICLGYNYKSGTLNTIDQVASVRLRCDRTLHDNITAIKSAKKKLIAANQNYRHNHRMQQSVFALNVFIILFVAQTGMNWAQVINLLWNDKFEVSSSRQLFRTIKYRANGKECCFELPLSFMPRFKKFLQLRKYILNQHDMDFLFFCIKDKGQSKPASIKAGSLYYIYNFLKKIDPNLVPVTSREWRVAKSDWLIRNTDPTTTSLILQNTEQTVLSSYISGSESKHWEEMSDFFNNISQVVLNRNKEKNEFLQGAVGQCSSYGNPSSLNNDLEVSVNCYTPEGCLFCDKYRIHVDATDIRKLLSCRYCIEKTAYLVGGIELQHITIQPIIDRIDLILDKLKDYDAELVERIMSEIEEGELDFYWAKKLEMFMELELIV